VLCHPSGSAVQWTSRPDAPAHVFPSRWAGKSRGSQTLSGVVAIVVEKLEEIIRQWFDQMSKSRLRRGPIRHLYIDVIV
jgi:hypothetical protein